MKKEKSQNKLLIIFAICSVALAVNANSINNPCLPAIYEEFSNAGTFIKNYIVNGQMIVALPFILLIGKLADKVNKKSIMLVGISLYLLGGIGGAFAPSMTVYAVCRSLVGIGMGIETTVIFGILFTCFPDPKESAKVMGFYQGASRLIGTLIPIAAGILCLKSWRTAAWLNAVAIITFFAIMFFLPKSISSDSGQNDSGAEKNVEEEIVDYKRVIFALVETCLFIIFGFVFFYFNSLYIAERGLGSSVLAGGLTAIFTVGGVLVNLVFGQVFGKLRRYTGVVAAFLLAGAFLLLGLDIPAWAVLPIAVLNGIACGIISSYYPIAVNENVPKSKTTFFQSIFSCVTFFAFTLVSYVLTALFAVFGEGYQKMLFIDGVIMLALGLIFLLCIKSFIVKKDKAQ